MKKIPTVILLCTLLFAVQFAIFFMKVDLSNTPVVKYRIAVVTIMTCTGATAGAAIGGVLHLIFRPSKAARLLEESSKLLSKAMEQNKLNDLNNLNTLRITEAITEEEFIEFKKEIMNRDKI